MLMSCKHSELLTLWEALSLRSGWAGFGKWVQAATDLLRAFESVYWKTKTQPSSWITHSIDTDSSYINNQMEMDLNSHNNIAKKRGHLKRNAAFCQIKGIWQSAHGLRTIWDIAYCNISKYATRWQHLQIETGIGKEEQHKLKQLTHIKQSKANWHEA